MREALHQAEAAAEIGEVPVGAVVVRDGEIIAKAYNHVETDRNSSGHAEMLAIREAERVLESKWLTGCELYVTLEPCAMCAGAMVLARLDRCDGSEERSLRLCIQCGTGGTAESPNGGGGGNSGGGVRTDSVGLLSEHARGEGTEAKTFPAENDIAGQY